MKFDIVLGKPRVFYFVFFPIAFSRAKNFLVYKKFLSVQKQFWDEIITEPVAKNTINSYNETIEIVYVFVGKKRIVIINRNCGEF